MIYKDYKDGIKLSTLGMGNMRLPLNGKEGDQNRTINYPEAHKILDYAISHGINYYDTAYVYNAGDSERCVGAWIKNQDRKSFYVATKWSIMANPDYKAVFEEQLERLQTDYIDFYLIHCLLDGNIDNYLNSGGIEYFLEQKRLGRIKYLGFSSHASVETLERFANHHDWDFAQLQINYYDWSYGSTEREYNILKNRNIPTIVMEPVRGGRLAALTPEAEALLKERHSDWSIASWALRYVRSLDNIQVILSGMSTLGQIEDNCNTFSDDAPLSKEDKEVLLKACELFHSQIFVPCTACRYCCDDCPMEINIPEYLKLYNDYKVDGPWALRGLSKIDSKGKPSDCIGCGSCTGHCPQSIDVPKIMEELAEKEEKNE